MGDTPFETHWILEYDVSRGSKGTRGAEDRQGRLVGEFDHVTTEEDVIAELEKRKREFRDQGFTEGMLKLNAQINYELRL